MDPHLIASMTSGLASRVNNLAVEATGQDSRNLMAQQDQLAKLAMAAIVQDLDNSISIYTDAVQSLADATSQADAALADITKVSQAIALIANAITKVSAVLA